MGFVIIFIIFGAISIAYYFYAQKQAEERRLRFLAYSQQHGFTYYPADPAVMARGGFWSSLTSGETGFHTRFATFEPFDRGHSRKTSNLLVKQIGDHVLYAFDYEYKITTSNGKSAQTTTYKHAIAAARLSLSLPNISMQPETIMHRVGEKFGLRELEFESEEFNKMYFIRSQDDRAAYDILDPQMIEYFLDQPPTWWQMGGYHLLRIDSRQGDVPEVHRAIQEVQGFVERIPPFVREDRAFQANWTSPLD
jgi:hypothetical protein